MENTTEVLDQGINCARFGNITGIDCSCLRDDNCSGCFIHTSLQQSVLDLADSDVEDTILESQTNSIVVH